RKPDSSIISSIFSNNEGKYRSASAIAKPHVGKATQAIELRRNAEYCSPSVMPYLSINVLISCFFSFVILLMIKFFFVVKMASSIVKPQLGKATQAFELRRNAEYCSPSVMPYLSINVLISCFFSFVTLLMIKFWFGVKRKSPV